MVEETIEVRDLRVLVDASNELVIVIVESFDGSMLSDESVMLIKLQVLIIYILLINRCSSILPSR